MDVRVRVVAVPGFFREAIAIVVRAICVFIDEAVAVVVHPVGNLRRLWTDTVVVVVTVALDLAQPVVVVV